MRSRSTRLLRELIPGAGAELWIGPPFYCDYGDNITLGGGAILCPGAPVGAGSGIGAGSVVTRDIPAGVFAADNPAVSSGKSKAINKP